MAVQLLIMTVCGIGAAMIAAYKGRSRVAWFFGGFFLGLIGLIIVAVLPNLNKERAFRGHVAQENRRLREQLKQERVKNEAFRRHAIARLDVHDETLGLDTRVPTALPGARPAARLPQGNVALPAVQSGADLPMRAQAAQPVPPPQRLWYYEEHGDTRGPVTEARLRTMLAAREVATETLVWCEDLGEWTPLGAIRFFNPESTL